MIDYLIVAALGGAIGALAGIVVWATWSAEYGALALFLSGAGVGALALFCAAILYLKPDSISSCD